MPRYIVIPLYDHTTLGEQYELLSELDRLELGIAPYLTASDDMPENVYDKATLDKLGICY